MKRLLIEARAVLRAITLVARAKVLLRSQATPAVLRRLAGPAPRLRRRGRSPDPSEALQAVRRAGRLVRASCLPQAVALAAMLRHGGVNPVVVLGCRRYDASEWGAHAWVEVGSLRLDPLLLAGHTELARLEPERNWELGARRT